MNWLLILVVFNTQVEMKFVTKEQCLGAVSFLNPLANESNRWPCAICLPPDVKYQVESESGGNANLNYTGQCDLREYRKELKRQLSE